MKTAGLSLLRWVVEATARLPGMHCRRMLFYADTPALVMHLTGRRDRYLMLPNGTTAPFPCFFEKKQQLEILRGERQTTEKFNFLRSRALRQITGYPGDRRITLRFGPRPAKPKDTDVFLAIHVMGARPLSLLVDDTGKILAADRQSNRYPVGRTYVPPAPPTLLNPVTMTFPDFLALLSRDENTSMTEILRRRVWGINEELANVLARGIDTEEWQSPEQVLWPAFFSVKSRIRAFLTESTRLVADPDSGELLDIDQQPDAQAGHSLNELLQIRLARSLQEDKTDDTREVWRKFANTQLKKVKRVEAAIQTRQDKADQAEKYKKWADILGIHRDRIVKGQAKVELPDPYADGRPITIDLDPAKGVQENIEGYYKKHRRGLAARTALIEEQTRLAGIRNLAEEILAQVTDIDPEQKPYPIVQWRERLEQVGVVPPKPGPSHIPQPAPRRQPYWEFTLAGGETIWVGRSAKDNDELTLKRAAKTDWFLHARQGKGAHVILRYSRSATPPAEETLRQAAEAAAFFSEARKSAAVLVTYTPIKYVRKPRKAPPGLVQLQREETMMVEPSPPPGYHGRAD